MHTSAADGSNTPDDTRPSRDNPWSLMSVPVRICFVVLLLLAVTGAILRLAANWPPVIALTGCSSLAIALISTNTRRRHRDQHEPLTEPPNHPPL